MPLEAGVTLVEVLEETIRHLHQPFQSSSWQYNEINACIVGGTVFQQQNQNLYLYLQLDRTRTYIGKLIKTRTDIYKCLRRRGVRECRKSITIARSDRVGQAGGHLMSGFRLVSPDQTKNFNFCHVHS